MGGFVDQSPKMKRRSGEKRSAVRPLAITEGMNAPKKPNPLYVPGYYIQYCNAEYKFDESCFLTMLKFDERGNVSAKTINGDNMAYMDAELVEQVNISEVYDGMRLWAWWPYKDDVVDQESGEKRARNGHFRLSKLIRLEELDEKENVDDLAELEKLFSGFAVEQRDLELDIPAILAEEADRAQNEHPNSKLKKEIEEMKVQGRAQNCDNN